MFANLQLNHVEVPNMVVVVLAKVLVVWARKVVHPHVKNRHKNVHLVVKLVMRAVVLAASVVLHNHATDVNARRDAEAVRMDVKTLSVLAVKRLHRLPRSLHGRVLPPVNQLPVRSQILGTIHTLVGVCGQPVEQFCRGRQTMTNQHCRLLGG